MVRLIPKTINGVTQWAEDAPTACGQGHARLAPTWAQCPDGACLAMCRQWRCLEDGCGEHLVDPDHVHRAGPQSQGERRGG